MKKFLRLIAGFALIFFFIFGLIPIISQNEKSQKMRQFIEENDIDANALFYTESERAGEVEFYFSKQNQRKLTKIKSRK